jgi:malonyl CoA-acyl carrier protein transacylase
MAAVSVSAYGDEGVAKLVRKLAQGEHRTVSNFIANAVVVFSGMPKDLRDTLLELGAEKDSAAFRSVVQEIAALVARRKLDIALRRLADQKRLPEMPEDASELDVLDARVSRSA